MATQVGGLGELKFSILDEVQFQQQQGPGWVLADGRSIVGSQLHALTGYTVIPDHRGRFIRASGAGALGSVVPDVYQSTFTADAGTDLLTIPALPGGDGVSVTHALTTGQRVQLTTTGTLPAGLGLTTVYFVIQQSPTTLRLATSFANALAGTFIDVTTTGSGTHTVHLSRGAGVGVQPEQFRSHAHVGGGYQISYVGGGSTDGANKDATGGSAGGSETRPVNVADYVYIRIN